MVDSTVFTLTECEERIQMFAQSLLDQGYSNYTVKSHTSLLRRIERTEIAGIKGYSKEKSNIWVQHQREKLLNGEISQGWFNAINTAVHVFNDFCTDGILVSRRHYNNLPAALPEPYASIHRDFLNSLPRQLSYRTIEIYSSCSKQFLEFLCENRLIDIKSLRFETVEKYLACAALHHSCSLEKVLHTMKMLLLFCGSDLDIGMIRPNYRRKAVLPNFSFEEVTEIFNAIGTSTPLGKRDYAIVSLAVFTGLRSRDILDLQLDDIDWKKRELSITQNKTGCRISLPLHVKAGEALANYILNGRPASEDRHIFLKSVAPYNRMVGNGTSTGIFQRCFNADSSLKAKCANKTLHSFRRSMGSWLSMERTPLPLISEILGHTNQEAAKFYLSFDFEDMKQCCLGLDGIPVLKEALL